jgi:hypothetical protein
MKDYSGLGKIRTDVRSSKVVELQFYHHNLIAAATLAFMHAAFIA